MKHNGQVVVAATQGLFEGLSLGRAPEPTDEQNDSTGAAEAQAAETQAPTSVSAETIATSESTEEAQSETTLQEEVEVESEEENVPQPIAVNPVSGEILFADATTEELWKFRERVIESVREVTAVRHRVESIILERMEKDNATKFEGQQGRGTIAYPVDHIYSQTVLESELKPLITEDEWKKACKMEPKPQHGALKQLKKRGGDIGAAIERAHHEKPKPPTLKYELKPQPKSDN